MNKPPIISLPSLVQYALLALPLAFAGLPLYIYAPDLYATHAGVSLGLIGILLMVARIIDAVQDPLIGKFSDDFAKKRLAILGIGSLGLGIGFVGLFNPIIRDTLAPIWFFGFLVLTTTCFSILTINLNAIGSLWSQDPKAKTKITTTREGFGLLGLVCAAAIPQVVFADLSPALAFASLSWAVLVGLVIAYLVFARWYAKDFTLTQQSKAQTYNILELIKSISLEKKIFYGIFLISMIASSVPSVLIVFFIRDLLGLEPQTGLFLLAYFASAIAGMPFWHFSARKFGKVQSWAGSMVLAVLTFIWAFTLGQGDFTGFMIVCVLSGLAMGAELSIPPAILSDLIDREKTQHQTSAYFALYAFIVKTAMALASGAAFGLLALTDFAPATENSAQALGMLSFAYAVMPCLIKLGSAALLFRSFKLFKIKVKS